ncbi:HAD family hydrolase [Marichromatium gracile]|uniref:Haloacid dehalogenase n=1 Tax=Marichromatium gracile TaxID=1048 RepID=A0ABR5VG41_MARGR|nr:HAD family hydrolase [Marichromatium gracile]KXX64616.1 haloacid dehalogenase [Marichromatium gracile]
MRPRLLLVCLLLPTLALADPLPSWRTGALKTSIIGFVDAVTTPGADFVPAEARIAVFDNDGTLWVEQPVYTQLVFAADRVRALAPSHPQWSTQPPFDAVLADDLDALAEAGHHAILELVAATHTGLSSAEFAALVSAWIAEARHPRFDRRYTDLVYQPMLELLAYLRAEGFKTFIVSGGGIDFMRPWTEAVYGIPPEQVIGSQIELVYEIGDDGQPRLMRQPEIGFVDDKAGKPVGIARHIGRRPILAVGNSDGDYQMLDWTTSGDGPRLGLLIHHDDPEREYAYDRDSAIGRLDQALDDAEGKGWRLVSMREDWLRVFPAAPSTPR